MNSPKEIAEYYVNTGLTKLRLSTLRTIVLAIFAGIYIALAGVGAVLVSTTVASASVAKFLGALVFPTGLSMVLLAGGELFTGNCLTVVPVLEKQAKVSALVRNLVLVYIGNFIGSVFIAYLAVESGTMSLFGNEAAGALIHTAIVKVNLSFSTALTRGILCNILVAVAVWMSYAAKDVAGKVAAMYLPVMLFVLSGYEHSIANMFYIPAGLFAVRNPIYAGVTPASDNIASLTWGGFFGNLVPSTIGNIIGGLVIIGAGYWLAYLYNEKKKEPAKRKK